MGVENPDIKIICFLESTFPRAIGGNVKTCSILNITGGTCEGLSSDWLQFRLNTDLITDFSQEGGCYIPDLIMCDGRKTTFGAGETMSHQEFCATIAGGCCV